MGHIKKIGETYYIEFYARGLLYQQKCGPDKAVAQMMLENIEEKIRRGEMGTIVRDVDIDIFQQTFLEFAEKQHTPQSFNRFKDVFFVFAEFIRAGCPQADKLSDITPGVIEQYKVFLLEQKRFKREPRKVNFHLLILREILEYGITLGYINDNPTLHVTFEKDRAVKPEVLSLEEIGHVLGVASPFLGEIIRFMLLTGMRFEEASRLEFTDIDFNENILCIRSYKGRNQESDPRPVPMEVEVREIMLRRKEAGCAGRVFPSFDEDRIKAEIDTIFKECGLKGKTFNCLRHTFAKTLIERGVGLIRVGILMGIDDLWQVMMYHCYVEERKLI